MIMTPQYRLRRKRWRKWCLLCLLFVPSALAHKCDGLVGDATLLCCVQAGHAIATEAEVKMLQIDANHGRVKDAIYADLVEDCLRRKREFVEGPCKPAYKLLYSKTKLTCTNPPFTTRHFMVHHLRVPPSPTLAEQHVADMGPSWSVHVNDQNLKVTQDCRQRRFLMWTRNNNDFYAGHKHKRFSLNCAFWEAHRLNRTLVLDNFTGMDKTHTGTDFSMEVPFAAWYKTEPLEYLPAGGMMYHEFVQGCGAPGVLSEENGDIVIVASGALQHEVAAKRDYPLLVREWDRQDPMEPVAQYGFHLCHNSLLTASAVLNKEPGVDYEVPVEYRGDWFAPWADQIGTQIMETLQHVLASALTSHEDALLVCLHVRRGDKIAATAQNQERYPNLAAETSAEGILETIEPYVPHGSVLYIATDEVEVKTFFQPLRKHYEVFTLAHMSEVFNKTDFMRPSLAMIDYEVLEKCKQLIPTFSSEETKGFDQHITLSKSDK